MNATLRRVFAIAVLLMFVAPVVRAAGDPTSPSLGGQWDLVLGASEFAAGRKLPKGRTDSIVHSGVWLDVKSRSVRSGGDSLALDYRYRTDGEATNKLMGQEIRTTGRRDGASWVFESMAKVLLLELKVREHWTLPASDTLVMERDTESPMGKEHQRLVFHRRKPQAK